MEFSNVVEKVNELLGRKEVGGDVSFSGSTPSYADFSKAFAQKFSIPEETVVVKNIFTKFGSASARFVVYVYTSVNEKNLFEPKVKVKKGKSTEGAAPEAAKA